MLELIALCVFLAVTASVYAILAMPRGIVQRRLATFQQMAHEIAAGDDPHEPEPGFMERVGRPVIKATLRVIGSVLPSSLITQLRWKLTLAGDPVGVTALLVIWAISGLLLPAAFALLVSLGNSGWSGLQILILLLITLIGLYLPNVWLKAKARQRQAQILKSLPDAIDLLTTSVEAGLGIDAALGQVSDKIRGPISPELKRVLREMAMGNSRRDALREFARRVVIPDVQQFVNALLQAEQMGVSLGQVIRVQSDQMRIRRRQRAEQQAYKAPVKMVFPLVLFIFPAIFVIILGPALIQIMEGINSQ
jgi:tight adherence protein C